MSSIQKVKFQCYADDELPRLEFQRPKLDDLERVCYDVEQGLELRRSRLRWSFVRSKRVGRDDHEQQSRAIGLVGLGRRGVRGVKLAGDGGQRDELELRVLRRLRKC